MAHQGVRAGAYQFVIVVQAGVDSELLPEMAYGGPPERGRHGTQEHGCRRAPDAGLRRAKRPGDENGGAFQQQAGPGLAGGRVRRAGQMSLSRALAGEWRTAWRKASRDEAILRTSADSSRGTVSVPMESRASATCASVISQMLRAGW